MASFVMWIFGGLFFALAACVGFIVNGFKNEMARDRVSRENLGVSFSAKVDKIEQLLQKFTDEFMHRLHKVETSCETLWTEHDLLKGVSHNCQSGYHHQRKGEPSNGQYPYRRSSDKVPLCFSLNDGTLEDNEGG